MPLAVRAVRGLSWLWSAIVFLLHTILENRSRPKLAVAAWHTSAAVAIATLSLAAVAAARQMGEGNRRPAVFLAIAVWPIMTGVVSFVVGMVLGAVLRGASRGSLEER